MKGRRYRFDGIEIDVSNLRVTVRGEIRPLEPKSFRLLLFLVENPHRAIPKEELMRAVWPDVAVSDNSLARAITWIRKALDDDPKAPVYVETVPSVGYRFMREPDAELETPAPTPPAEATVAPAGASAGSSRRIRSLTMVAACVTLAAGAGVVAIRARWFPPDPYPLHVTRVTKLTSYPGDEREPAVSPDGSYVAFSWSGADGGNYDIYVVQAGGEPLRLTRDPAPDSFPAWSPDGRQIAFIRREGSHADIIVVPPLGGPERVLHRFFRIGADLDFTQHPVLSWSSDGRQILYSGQARPGEAYRLQALSVENGSVRAISSPEKESVGDSSPAISPDGKFLAFVRYLAPRNGKVLVQALDRALVLQGEAEELTQSGLAAHSPVWLGDSGQLLFADARQIFQWQRSKGIAPLYSAEGNLGGMAIGPAKRNSWQVVVASEKADADIWAFPLDAGGMKATEPAQVLLRSTENDSHPDFSPDGRRIAFISARSGTQEIWLSNADGGDLRQLTHLGAHIVSYPKWSPDGTRIVFHARAPDVAQVYVVDADRGVPRRITQHNPGLAVATWSNDSRFIYASTLVGGVARSFRFPAEGGPTEALWEGGLFRESVDGEYVLYRRTNRPGIFRRLLKGDPGKNPEELLVPDFWPNNQLGGFQPVADGVYYVSADAHGRPGPFRFFKYASRTSIDVAPAMPGLHLGLTISPDRRRLLFSASAEVGGDLLSLELR
jgi:Tol biopolymer transport system component/DNA-binding winged helix-turn-helix (wHTH) protein